MADATLPLDRTPDDPRRARRFVESQLDGVPGDVRADALLMVSELVTNVVRHGESPAHLEVTLRPDLIRVSVYDSAKELPRPRVSAPGEFTGRGLVILAALASAWGVDAAGGDGKQVWFELARDG